MNPPDASTPAGRRHFLKVAGLGAAGWLMDHSTTVGNAAIDRGRKKFFTVGQRQGHWWFLTPEGAPFWSIGMNHIDSSTLRYAESGGVWRQKYRNSQERWLKEAVAPDLRAWGFNTVGWTQEVVVRGQTIHRHSPPFTFEEYEWLGLPYCHLLPFSETHQWEAETRHPDFFSQDFADWCDYVARAQCARLADDPRLIGYFHVDCPTWVHTRPFNTWKGPLFDPQKLATDAGRRELQKLASRYYQVTHDAIRRYDPHHLILGDRYEAKAPLPEEILQAAAPFVDVLSFQYFGQPEEIVRDFRRWHALTGRPVLLADASAPARKPERYAELLRALRAEPGCVGWHVCGAYLKNHARGYGFKDEQDRPIAEWVESARQANRETAAWVKQVTGGR